MWKWVKVPKALALLAFFLPWMTVSCSGQKLVSATGAGLAVGRYRSDLAASRAARSVPESLDGWIIAAIVLVVIGLVVAFSSPTRRNALLVALTSFAAAILCWAGTLRFSERNIAEAIVRDHPDQQLDLAEAAKVLQIEWHYGYWITLAALIVAGAMAAVVAGGRDLALTAPPRAP